MADAHVACWAACFERSLGHDAGRAACSGRRLGQLMLMMLAGRPALEEGLGS